MGKVTVFCVISGSVPEIDDALDFSHEEDLSETSPNLYRVMQEKLLDSDDQEGRKDLTVIGPIDKHGVTLYDDPDGTVPDIPEDLVRVIKHCQMGDSWDFGFITNPHGQDNLVSYFVNIMVQTTSLAILETATDNRVTPLRLWKWCMSVGSHRGYAMESWIDYKGPDLEQFPNPFPPLDPSSMGDLALEDKSDEEILDFLIWRGSFWVWMRPDTFPILPDSVYSASPLSDSFTTPSAASVPTTILETLPIELLTVICTLLDVRSFTSLTQTNHNIRSILMVPSLLDPFARQHTWMYHPGTGEAAEAERKRWDARVQELQKLQPENSPSSPGFEWQYLKRCQLSPSMRNRRRIWDCVEQIEAKIVEYETTGKCSRLNPKSRSGFT